MTAWGLCSDSARVGWMNTARTGPAFGSSPINDGSCSPISVSRSRDGAVLYHVNIVRTLRPGYAQSAYPSGAHRPIRFSTIGVKLSGAQVIALSASLVTFPVTSSPTGEGYLRLYEDGDPYCPSEQYHSGFSMDYLPDSSSLPFQVLSGSAPLPDLANAKNVSSTLFGG